MIRSRWFALQAATLLLAAFAVPNARAQGLCPFKPQFQMQMQTRFMAPPPMMMVPQVQRFQPRIQPMPQLTPPRMPINFNVTRPTIPQNNFNVPRFNTPAFTARVPTFTPRLNVNTTTTWRPNTTTQLHTMRFPTLQVNRTTWHVNTPNIVAPRWGGPGLRTGTFTPRVNWSLATGVKFIPKLGLGTARWSTTTTSRTPITTNRFTGNVGLGNRTFGVPALSFNKRPPAFVPTRPLVAAPRNIQPVRPGTFNPNPALTRKPNFPNVNPNAKPGMNQVTGITGRLNFACGSCHNCKQGAAKPGLLAAKPVIPIFRPLVLPAQLPPPILAPRPMLTFIAPPAPIIRQPLSPIVFITNVRPLPVLPLTVAQPLALTGYPKLTPLLGKTQATPPASLHTTYTTKTDLVAETPPKRTKAFDPKVPLVVADIAPPKLPPTERTVATELRAVSVLEMIGAAEAQKPAVRAASQSQEALVVTLLQPPPLPSGAPVTPVELEHPILDEPPVLPVLVDSLIQPPALPPLPGA